MRERFKRFLKSSFGLEIWSGEKIVFRSRKRGISGLMGFVSKYGRKFRNLIVFDKKIGQGAAFVLIYLKIKEVFAKTGSRLAKKVLKKAKITFYFEETVPQIPNRTNDGLCPIEQLSIGKTPKEFYALMKKKLKKN